MCEVKKVWSVGQPGGGREGWGLWYYGNYRSVTYIVCTVTTTRAGLAGSLWNLFQAKTWLAAQLVALSAPQVGICLSWSLTLAPSWHQQCSDGINTTKHNNMESLEIPFKIGSNQKWISGISSETTCKDILVAVLKSENFLTSQEEEEQNVHHKFALVETWRSVITTVQPSPA